MLYRYRFFLSHLPIGRQVFLISTQQLNALWKYKQNKILNLFLLIIFSYMKDFLGISMYISTHILSIPNFVLCCKLAYQMSFSVSTEKSALLFVPFFERKNMHSDQRVTYVLSNNYLFFWSMTLKYNLCYQINYIFF